MFQGVSKLTTMGAPSALSTKDFLYGHGSMQQKQRHCYVWFGQSTSNSLTPTHHCNNSSEETIITTQQISSTLSLTTCTLPQVTTHLSRRPGEQGDRWSGWSCPAPSHRPESHWGASHAWWPASPGPRAGTLAACASAGTAPWSLPVIQIQVTCNTITTVSINS